jgi:O-antigen/teichoic acid export membrane protein
MLKRNIIANYLGQGWSALMGIAFIPLYIKYLGIEAYGLIGLFAVLQAGLKLLDMGMTPTMGREMARYTSGAHTEQSIRDLLRTVEYIAIVIFILIAGSVSSGSTLIATNWLKAESLPIEVLAEAFFIMGFVTALRFIEGIYRSCITGLQHQVFLNIVTAFTATLRGIGAVVILAWVSPTIHAFFLWQAVVSIVTLTIFCAATYSKLPRLIFSRARFSMAALRKIWRFAGGVLGINILSFLLTQTDKIVLPTVISLREYGYYIMAATLSAGLHMVISPITQAIYPRLCELHSQDNKNAFATKYHKGAQFVSVIAGSIALVLIVFAENFLNIWTQNLELAVNVSGLLSVLMLGSLVNGMMWMPYQAQLAHGWTSLAVRINFISVVLLVPSILWAAENYGAEGASWAWLLLNVGYFSIGAFFMYKTILKNEKISWYINDVMLPIGAGLLICIIVKEYWPATQSFMEEFVMLLVAACLTLFATAMSARHVRNDVIRLLKMVFSDRMALSDKIIK